MPSSITIPFMVEEIEVAAMKGNPHVNVVYFESTPLIKSEAFKDCENLISLFFEWLDVPTIATGAFTNTMFIVYVPYNWQQSYATAFAGYNCSISSIDFKVTFYSGEFVCAEYVTYYGKTITEIFTPSGLVGVAFDGWYDNPECTGIRYENGDIWLKQEDISLYAKWVLIMPNSGDGGGGISDAESS